MSTSKHFVIQIPNQKLSTKVQNFLFEHGYVWGNTIIKNDSVKTAPNEIYEEEAAISHVEEHGEENTFYFGSISSAKSNYKKAKFFNAATQFDEFVKYIKGEPSTPPDLKSFVISTPTKEIWDKAIEFLIANGYRWINGNANSNASWDDYKQDSSINFCNGNDIWKIYNKFNEYGFGFTDYDWCKDSGYFRNEHFFSGVWDWDKFEDYIKGETMNNQNSKNYNVYYKASSQSDAIAAMYVYMTHYNITGFNPIDWARCYPWAKNQWIGMSFSISTWTYSDDDYKSRPTNDSDAIFIDTNLTDLVAALKGEYLVEPPAPEIHGYKGKIIDLEKVNVGYDWIGTIEFGCAKIGLATLQDIYKWMIAPAVNANRSILSITLDSGKVLTRENISGILDYFDKYWEYQQKKKANENR